MSDLRRFLPILDEGFEDQEVLNIVEAQSSDEVAAKIHASTLNRELTIYEVAASTRYKGKEYREWVRE